MATFLSLPTELRNQIYEQYISVLAQNDAPFLLELSPFTMQHSLRFRKTLPKLAQTCQFIRRELLPIWASHLTIDIKLDCLTCRDDQRQLLDFLDLFATLIPLCKDFKLPFCKILLAGKRVAGEKVDEDVQGNTLLVIVDPTKWEEANVALLRATLWRNLHRALLQQDHLTVDDVKGFMFGPMRAMGMSYVKWDPEKRFEGIWEGGSCLRSRMRGL